MMLIMKTTSLLMTVGEDDDDDDDDDMYFKYQQTHENLSMSGMFFKRNKIFISVGGGGRERWGCSARELCVSLNTVHISFVGNLLYL